MFMYQVYVSIYSNVVHSMKLNNIFLCNYVVESKFNRKISLEY